MMHWGKLAFPGQPLEGVMYCESPVLETDNQTHMMSLTLVGLTGEDEERPAALN